MSVSRGLEQGEVPPDAFTVFVSYSGYDNHKRAVLDFVDDLANYFGRETGGIRRVNFEFHTFGGWNRQGNDFRPEIDKTLNPANVLLPVFSAYYFRSTWCARELGAFMERLSVCGFELTGDVFLPVRWGPEEGPPRLQKFRVGWDQEPSYRRLGLRRLQEDDPTTYQRVVKLLGDQLVAIWNKNLPAVPPGTGMISNAALGFRPRNDAKQTRGRKFFLMPGSVSLSELRTLEGSSAPSNGVEVRERTHYYGPQPANWDPFRSEGVPEAASQVVEAIEDGTWHLRMKTADPSPQALTSDWREQLFRELPGDPGSRPADTVVVAYLDSWLLHYPYWKNRIRTLAACRGYRTLWMVPKPSDDQFVRQWEAALGRALEETLAGGDRADGMIHRECHSIEEFRNTVVYALTQLCAGGAPQLR